jgi:hypothetical protein
VDLDARMNNSPKPKTLSLAVAPEAAPERQNVIDIVEALLKVLERADADATEGVMSLLAAFTQGAQGVLDASDCDNLEANRDLLLSMLERVSQTIERWPSQGSSMTIH